MYSTWTGYKYHNKTYQLLYNFLWLEHFSHMTFLDCTLPLPFPQCWGHTLFSMSSFASPNPALSQARHRSAEQCSLSLRHLVSLRLTNHILCAFPVWLYALLSLILNCKSFRAETSFVTCCILPSWQGAKDFTCFPGKQCKYYALRTFAKFFSFAHDF